MANPAVAAPVGAAATHQAGQAALASQIADPLEVAWASFDPGDPTTLQAFILAIQAIVQHFSKASSAAAAAFYDHERLLAGVPGNYTVQLAPPVPQAKVEAGVRWATSDLWSPQPNIEAIRTKVQGVVEKDVLDPGRLTILEAVHGDRKAIGWARVPEPGACSFCALLATRGMSYRSEKTAGFESHDHCVPGDTLVNGPSTEIGYRRWYEGEVIIIRIAGGAELTITPNHPVLTDRGWIPAGLLHEGDQVVQRTGADLASLDVPHEHDVPSRIQDVWRSHSVDGLRRVPVTTEDFHGDVGARNGDVEIVWANSLLSQVLNALLTELLAHPISSGAGTSPVAVQFLGASGLSQSLRALGETTTGLMGGGGQLCSSHWAELLHPELVGVTPPSGRYAGFQEPTPHGPARNGEFNPDFLFGGSGDIGSDGFRVDGHSVVSGSPGPWTRFDPASAQDEAKGLGVHSHLGRSLLERLSGGIQLRSVLNLRRIDYSGHVFNLQTAEGWYDANSLVVSNCRCHAEPVFTEYEPSAQIREWQQIYTESTKGIHGPKAMRRAFRKALAAR